MADRILQFYRNLDASHISLPAGIQVINPYRESTEAMAIARQFYNKYYNDEKKTTAYFGH